MILEAPVALGTGASVFRARCHSAGSQDQPGAARMVWTCFRKVESSPYVKGEPDDEAEAIYEGV